MEVWIFLRGVYSGSRTLYVCIFSMMILMFTMYNSPTITGSGSESRIVFSTQLTLNPRVPSQKGGGKGVIVIIAAMSDRR